MIFYVVYYVTPFLFVLIITGLSLVKKRHAIAGHTAVIAVAHFMSVVIMSLQVIPGLEIFILLWLVIPLLLCLASILWAVFASRNGRERGYKIVISVIGCSLYSGHLFFLADVIWGTI